MADQKATALAAFTPILSDILYGVDDPGGTPVSGKVTLTAIRDLLQANITTLIFSNGSIISDTINHLRLRVSSASGSIEFLTSGGVLGGFYKPSTGQLSFGSGKLSLSPNGSNTLQQANSTNAQTFNIYNTITDGSNYERGGFKWNTNVLEVFSEAAGTGTQRDVVLNGANRATKISDPSGGTTVDSEARTAINAIIDALEAHGISAAA